MGQKEYIAQRIRTMRLSRGMTQADLARAIDQSQSSITMYETGRREPDFETLEALADVFNVPIVSFVDGGGVVSINKSDDEYQPKNDDVRLLVRGFNQFTPDEIDQAKAMMKIMFAKHAKYFEEEKSDDT